MVFGFLIIIFSLYLPVGTFGNPGEGLVPLVAGVCMCILSIVVFFRSYLQGSSETKVFTEKKQGLQVVFITIMALLIFPVIFEYLGFLIATFFLLFFLFKVIGEMKWKLSLVGTLLTTLCSYLIFNVWLKVQFPRGLLEILLGI
jgi:cellulose synthase/poly-beta-1,6-N-acetylglucosamine synthase-like glycosyltransferase